MFQTLKQRLLLGMFIFILLSIPIGAYLVSQNQTIKSTAKEEKPKKTATTITGTPKPTTSAAKSLFGDSTLSPSPSPSPAPSEPTIPTSFGPTLTLKTTLEGRSPGNQATKLFVGILEGALTSNPKFLLNFMVELPASGEYSGLSLAGLESGTSYTALLKGSAQIATSATFVMTPNVTNLNSGEALNMLSGDLNDDNVINSSDYSIAKKALGSAANSAKWNENADLNKDGIVNGFDLSIISKNIGKIGASGAWTSPLPQISTPSAGLSGPPIGGATPSGDYSPEGESKGYWLWIPK